MQMQEQIFIPILQMESVRPSEVNTLAQGARPGRGGAGSERCLRRRHFLEGGRVAF